MSVAEEIRKMELRGRVSDMDVAAAKGAVERMSASDPERLAAMNAMENLERVARTTAYAFSPTVGKQILGLFGAGMTPGQRSWIHLATLGSSALDEATGRDILATFRGGMDSFQEEWVIERLSDAAEQKKLRDEAAAHKKAWDTRGRKAKEAAAEGGEGAEAEAEAPKKKAKKEPKAPKERMAHLPDNVRQHILKADADGKASCDPPGFVKADEIRLNMNYDPHNHTDPKARMIYSYKSKNPKTGKVCKKNVYSNNHSNRSTATKFENLGPYMDKHPQLVKQVVDKIDPSLLKSGKPTDINNHGAFTALAVIAITGIRSGSMKEAAEAGHFGCSQLKPEHVNIENGVAHFCFMGKGQKEGKKNTAEVRDPKVVAAIDFHKKQAAKEKRKTLWPSGTTYSLIEKRNGEMRNLVKVPWHGTLHSWRTLKASVTTQDHLKTHGNIVLHKDPKKAREQIASVLKAAIHKGATAINDEDETAQAHYIDPKVITRYLGGLKGYSAAVHGDF